MGSYDAGTATSTYAVFTGNDTLTGFKLGTDIIKLTLDPNLYQTLLKEVLLLNPAAGNTLTGALFDSIGIANFTNDGINTTITFGGTATPLGSLILKNVIAPNFTYLDTGVAGTHLQIIAPTYVAPVLNAAAAFDPVFLNDTTQPLAFQNLIDSTTTHLSSLVYTTTSTLPNGVTLNTNGTLSITGMSSPQTFDIIVAATNAATGDSIILPTQRILVGNASEITYNTAHGAGSTFNGTLTTPGAYEVQAATVSGGGAADVDLSQGSVHASSQLIYNTGTGTPKTIYGNTQNISETSHNVVDSKTYTFDANLIHTTPGIAGSDQTFGNAKNLTIAPTVSGTDVGSFTNNTLTFATNTIYGTGNLYGNFQLFKLDTNAGLVTISGNSFTLGQNQLTVLGDGATDTTTIYPHVKDLVLTSDISYTKITSTSQVVPTITFSNNTFTFGDSRVTGGQGNMVVHTDPTLSQTDPNAYAGFVSPVMVTSDGNNHVITTTTDGLNNKIIWGNNTLVSGDGVNTYNFTLLQNSAGSYDAGTAKSTYAVFTGNDSVTGFKLGTDVIKLNLDPNLYHKLSQLAGNAVLTGTLLDSIGIARFTYDNISNTTTITFGGTGQALGSLVLKGINVSNFAALDPGVAGTYLQITTPTSYVAPTVNSAITFDSVFLNNTTQTKAFQNLIDSTTTHLSSLVYTAVGLPIGMALSSEGTLTISGITAPQTTNVTVTVTNPVTGDSVVLPTQRIFVGTADQITYNAINGSLGTTGTHETQSSTFSGSGISDIDLSLGSTIVAPQLIYNTGTSTAKTIYGNTQNITETTSSVVDSQTYTFDAHLIHTTTGMSGADHTYGNAQNLTIDPSFGGNFTNNTLTFATNAIYGTGNLYGNLDLLKIDITANSAVLVQGNTFNFAGNHLTSGSYTPGTNTLVGDTTNPTNLYASIKTLDFDFDCTQSVSTITAQFTGNSFTFGDSVLTGVGATNFYGDVADLSQSSFVLSVTATNTAGHIQVTDPYGNKVTFGNDTFISNGNGGNSYTFTFMTSETVSGTDTIYKPIMQGFDTIEGFTPSSDTLVLNIASPLYNKLVNGNNGTPTLTVAELNAVSSDTDNTAMFYFEYTGANTVLHLDGGGSITFTGQHLTSFSDFNNLTLHYNYFDPPIEAITPTQPLLFDGTQSYYSLFSPYFKNVDIMDPNTTYTITIDGVKTTGISLWDKPQITENFGSKTIEVGMNDAHVPDNHPSFTAIIDYAGPQNSQDPDFGAPSPYDSITVNAHINSQGDRVLNIGNEKQDTAIGADNRETYNFTILSTEGWNSQAIFQGFHTIENFNITTDKLSFALPFKLYDTLDSHNASSIKAATLFTDNGIIIIQNEDSAILKFAGGGEISLTGYGIHSGYTPQSLKTALLENDRISLDIMDLSQNYEASNSNINSGAGSIAASAAAMIGAMVMTADASPLPLKHLIVPEKDSSFSHEDKPSQVSFIDHQHQDPIASSSTFIEESRNPVTDHSTDSHGQHIRGHDLSSIQDSTPHPTQVIGSILEQSQDTEIKQSLALDTDSLETHSPDLWIGSPPSSPTHSEKVSEHSHTHEDSQEKSLEVTSPPSTPDSSSLENHHSPLEVISENVKAIWDQLSPSEIGALKWAHSANIKALVENDRTIDIEKLLTELKANRQSVQNPSEHDKQTPHTTLPNSPDPMDMLDHHLQEHIAHHGHQDLNIQNQQTTEHLNSLKQPIAVP